MNYILERAVYYYFLMQEITGVGIRGWKFVAELFGVLPEDIKAYEAVLENPILAEISTVGDAKIYKNYLSGFCCEENEFGKADNEQDVIEAKALALDKICTLFGEESVKNGRLRALAHVYERDHIASVLYAIQALYLNDGDKCGKFAESILMKELKDGNNSDAGLVLLKLKNERAEEVMNLLSGTPDMILRPDLLNSLIKQFGGEGTDAAFNGKRVIGF